MITLTPNPALDVSVEVERVRPNRKLRTSAARRDPGGGGINVARVLTRLGGRAQAWFPAGGPAGDMLVELLDGEEVVSRTFPVDGMTRENTTVSETGDGDQYRFVLPGAELAGEEWQEILDALGRTDPPPVWVVGSGSLPPGVPDDFWARVARVVREGGGSLVLDSSGDALAAALEEGVALVKPNARELGEILGRSLDSEEEQVRAARSVVDDGGAGTVVLSLGASGVLAVDGEGRVERIHAPSVRPRSRVGAGDSTVAGIVRGLSRGDGLAAALRLGVAAGAAAVSTPGTELARAEDVDRIRRSMGDGAGGGAVKRREER